MAKEYVVWCDKHLAVHGEKKESSTFVVSLAQVGGSSLTGKIPAGTPLSVDLCVDCQNDLIDGLASALVTWGERETSPGQVAVTPMVTTQRERKARNEGTYPCLLCPGIFNSNFLFTSHLAKAHGTKATELYGMVCPVDKELFLSAPTLGTHISKNHADLGSTTAQVFAAMKDSDPHGIVAGLIAKHMEEHADVENRPGYHT